MTLTTLITESIAGLPIKLAKNQFAQIWHSRKIKRFERFLSQLQTETDLMSEDHRRKLNDYVDTEEGQDRLIEFSDSVLSTSDRRVHIALALLYCNDRDYPLSDKERHTFCMAMRNIHPDLVNFYLKLEGVQPTQLLETQLDRFSFINRDLDHGFFGDYSPEELSELVTELINLKLLMPDPKSHITVDDDMGRIISWGMSDSKILMMGLLKKAELILGK